MPELPLPSQSTSKYHVFLLLVNATRELQLMRPGNQLQRVYIIVKIIFRRLIAKVNTLITNIPVPPFNGRFHGKLGQPILSDPHPLLVLEENLWGLGLLVSTGAMFVQAGCPS